MSHSVLNIKMELWSNDGKELLQKMTDNKCSGDWQFKDENENNPDN